MATPLDSNMVFIKQDPGSIDLPNGSLALSPGTESAEAAKSVSAEHPESSLRNRNIAETLKLSNTLESNDINAAKLLEVDVPVNSKAQPSSGSRGHITYHRTDISDNADGADVSNGLENLASFLDFKRHARGDRAVEGDESYVVGLEDEQGVPYQEEDNIKTKKKMFVALDATLTVCSLVIIVCVFATAYVLRILCYT